VKTEWVGSTRLLPVCPKCKETGAKANDEHNTAWTDGKHIHLAKDGVLACGKNLVGLTAIWD
jgi:hypothetical protein